MIAKTVLVIKPDGQYTISCPPCSKLIQHRDMDTSFRLTFRDLTDAHTFAERLRASSVERIVRAGNVLTRMGYGPCKHGSYCAHIPAVAVQANPRVYRLHGMKVLTRQ